jgi:hypothetical protein
LRCLKCQHGLGPGGVLRIWTLRTAPCPSCGAEHSLKLPRGARPFIKGFTGLTYGLTVLAGTSMGWSFLASSGAYLLGLLFGTVTLILPFALTGRFSIERVDGSNRD